MRVGRLRFIPSTRVDGWLSAVAGAVLLLLLAMWTKMAAMREPLVEAAVGAGAISLIMCGLTGVIIAHWLDRAQRVASQASVRGCVPSRRSVPVSGANRARRGRATRRAVVVLTHP